MNAKPLFDPFAQNVPAQRVAGRIERPLDHPADREGESQQPQRQEESMPSGVYPRKKSNVGIQAAEAVKAEPEKIEDAPPPKKRGRPKAKKAKSAPARKARGKRGRGRRATILATPEVGSIPRRFAVWDDGSVDINVSGCQGTLSAADASALVDHIKTHQAKA